MQSSTVKFWMMDWWRAFEKLNMEEGERYF